MFPSRTYKRRTRTLTSPQQNGHDVQAVQINLNYLTGLGLTEDGILGPKSFTAIKTFQKQAGLEPDGKAGPLTDRAMGKAFVITAQEGFNTPVGLIDGQIEGESGWDPGAVSFLSELSHHQIDCGLTGYGVTEWTDEKFHDAFNGLFTVSKLAEALRTRKDYFRTLPGGNTDEKAWKIAVGWWNWKTAAAQFAKGTIDTWTYYETITKADGTKINVSRTMDEPANWIKNIGVPGISTGYQWWNYYISTKTIYVTQWTP